MADNEELDISEEMQRDLKSIIDAFDIEDRPVRERQLRLWKKLNYYWAGFQRVWWNEVAHDWRVFDAGIIDDSSVSGESSFYDKPINVFRAYLESIIAAMSVTVPAITCFPDDAENINDVLTAKGGDKIAELIFKHVDAPLLWCKALFVYCTQGMVAAYNYSESNDKYGLVPVSDYENSEEDAKKHYCPNCKMPMPELDLQHAIQMEMQESDEFMPDNDDIELHAAIDKGQVLCTNCQTMIDPEIKDEKVIVERMIGFTNKPKSRQKIEVNGGLFVKVPNYARCQDDVPYLAYCYETHYTNIFAKYKHLRGQIDQNAAKVTSSGYEMYERWARLSTQYFGEFPVNTPTVRNWWLRPSAFEVINDDVRRKALYKKFPDGCKAVFINESFAEACNENLDDCWTLTYNPLSEYIHFDPLGLLLTSVQEITNDIISLVLQTIEHGIPQTFADPNVLNFEQYRQTEATPGQIFPAKPKSGKAIGDAFYDLKTASLSAEVEPFGEKVQELGQFVSGALPSLWGGAADNSSKTAAQYSMARTQAMQRLQTPWKMFGFWWKNIFGKVVPAYIKNMLADEKFAKKENGNFISVVIKKAEMDGKIGSVELEASDQLPSNWGTEKDVIMGLFNTNNPEILAALADPKNLPLIAQALGLADFYIPGEDDRQKQLEEIQLLLQSTSIPDGTGQETSSIQPEPIVDNHVIEASICKQWCVSEVGRQTKSENPAGYKNVLLHLQAHLKLIQPQTPDAGMPQSQQKRPMQQKKLRPTLTTGAQSDGTGITH